MSAATPVLAKELKGRVLVASPYAPLRQQMLKRLDVPPTVVSEAQGGADALLKLEKTDFGTLLLDPRIEDLDVGELMATLRGRYPDLDVVLMESDSTRDEGAIDRTPAEASMMSGVPKTKVPVAQSFPASRQYSFPISPDPAESTEARMRPVAGMIGRSQRMQQIYRLARLVAPRDAAVLIVGETGPARSL